MSEQRQPRIGVIGTGAIGGFYGLMLARAGFDVNFLLRSEYAGGQARWFGGSTVLYMVSWRFQWSMLGKMWRICRL